ncbi:MAG: hypothetical protein NTY68_00340 [Candidatus Micrarchaeota archaeon]|nr:hypothetical protein [Candidatus Micrarchaeota archaeon]
MKNIGIPLLFLLAVFASLSFAAYPPGQPGDKTCTKDLESMVNYCTDYCTRMAGNGSICMLCSTSASERGVLDACLCQNSKRQPLNFYNISCTIPVSEQMIPQSQEQNATQNESNASTKNESSIATAIINKTDNAPKPAAQNTTQNKTSNATIITPNQDNALPEASQDSGTTVAIYIGIAAIVLIALWAILGRKRE